MSPVLVAYAQMPLLDRIAQSVTCLTTDTCLTADPDVYSSDFLALLYVMFFFCVFVTFPYSILGHVGYLIVLIPDICLLPYFDPGPVPYYRGDWSWNNFYGHSPPFRWFKKSCCQLQAEVCIRSNRKTFCISGENFGWKTFLVIQ